MSKIIDTINMAEGALQVGNEALAIRIMLTALRDMAAGQQRITPDETGAVISARKRGFDVATTAMELGISETRVRRILRLWDRMYPFDWRVR